MVKCPTTKWGKISDEIFFFFIYFFIFILFFPGLDVMPFPTTPSTRGKRAGQGLKSGTSKSS